MTDTPTAPAEDDEGKVSDIVQDWVEYTKDKARDAAVAATDALIARLQEAKTNLGAQE